MLISRIITDIIENQYNSRNLYYSHLLKYVTNNDIIVELFGYFDNLY